MLSDAFIGISIPFSESKHLAHLQEPKLYTPKRLNTVFSLDPTMFAIDCKPVIILFNYGKMSLYLLSIKLHDFAHHIRVYQKNRLKEPSFSLSAICYVDIILINN